MRKRLYFIFLLVNFSFLQAIVLEIEVSNIDTKIGNNIVFTVSKNDAEFPKNPSIYRIVKITRPTHSVKFYLDEGYYGVYVYHDENGNKEIDRYFFGMPKEEIAVYNYDYFGMPDFERSRFYLSENKVIKLKLNY
jgi:uncharacterized protein (DUF2141 family)